MTHFLVYLAELVNYTSLLTSCTDGQPTTNGKHKPSAGRQAQILANAAENVSDSLSCYLSSNPGRH